MKALAGAILGFAVSMTGAIVLVAACPYAGHGEWVPLLRLAVGACTAGGVAFGACVPVLAEMKRAPSGVPQRETVP